MRKIILTAVSVVLFASTATASESQILECTTVGKGTLKVSIFETAVEKRFSARYENRNHQVGGSHLAATVTFDMKEHDRSPSRVHERLGAGYYVHGFSLTWLNGKPLATIFNGKFSPYLGNSFDYCENLSTAQANKVEHALKPAAPACYAETPCLFFGPSTTPVRVK